jgi:NAD(P)-dependent dehydrogenase (short-subunit alcohol dehydrogenase family)
VPFEGTTAIVTGGASGLGLTIAEALVARGSNVAIFDIQRDKLHAEVARLRADGAKISGHVVDVSDRAQVRTAVDEVRAEFGPVLILVNNAGIEQFGKFAAITDGEWDRIVAVNLRGQFICTQEALLALELEKAIAEGRFTASLEHFAAITTVRRAGWLEDIANAVISLCADESSYTTGQVIPVNGGRRT